MKRRSWPNRLATVTYGRRARPLRVARLALAVAAVASLLLGVYGVSRTLSYVEDDPSFCRTCHTMNQAYDRWQTGEHKDVTCHSCHKPDIAANLRQVWKYVTQRPHEVSTTATVSSETCIGCHSIRRSSPAAAVSSAAASSVSAEQDMHHIGQARTDCLSCHGDGLHRFQVQWSAVCAACH
ncbi:MAG: NapC/NirT family cytochrome c [Chloroflexota bacterium]|nr:NapC/NirT family cytochrome c [Chloroflexota bacterium]